MKIWHPRQSLRHIVRIARIRTHFYFVELVHDSRRPSIGDISSHNRAKNGDFTDGEWLEKSDKRCRLGNPIRAGQIPFVFFSNVAALWIFFSSFLYIQITSFLPSLNSAREEVYFVKTIQFLTAAIKSTFSYLTDNFWYIQIVTILTSNKNFTARNVLKITDIEDNARRPLLELLR